MGGVEGEGFAAAGLAVAGFLNPSDFVVNVMEDAASLVGALSPVSTQAYSIHSQIRPIESIIVPSISKITALISRNIYVLRYFIPEINPGLFKFKLKLFSWVNHKFN